MRFPHTGWEEKDKAQVPTAWVEILISVSKVTSGAATPSM